MLKSSRPKGGDAASKEEYNKALKWDKYQTSVRDLFNINIDSQKEPDADAKNQIQKLQDKFSRISQLKGSTGEPKDRKKPRLFCGEQGIPSMPAGETIAEEESEKAKERPAGRYGAWVYPQRKSKSVNKRIPLSKFDKGDYEKDVDHPCKAGGKAFALTKNDANAIFICDRGMEFQAKLIAPEEGKSMAKTLMKNRALSDTLLHEMFHLFWNRMFNGSILMKLVCGIADRNKQLTMCAKSSSHTRVPTNLSGKTKLKGSPSGMMI
ncbi:hypothetical protein SLS55_006769 [Diplodia seriata]|uniref:SprT-like domain-containing protein n=1 Tax=Diplodia seriata TaxID=420778 RepID=A0ABR3CFG9_9PEZI